MGSKFRNWVFKISFNQITVLEIRGLLNTGAWALFELFGPQL